MANPFTITPFDASKPAISEKPHINWVLDGECTEFGPHDLDTSDYNKFKQDFLNKIVQREIDLKEENDSNRDETDPYYKNTLTYLGVAGYAAKITALYCNPLPGYWHNVIINSSIYNSELDMHVAFENVPSLMDIFYVHAKTWNDTTNRESSTRTYSTVLIKGNQYTLSVEIMTAS